MSLFKACLGVGFSLFLLGNGLEDSREPIVKRSDPSMVTHKISSKGVTLGFSDLGGGYLNYVDLGDGKNINSYRYGRGWQHSLRDMFHSGRYNPTQAGFRDFAGTPVRLVVPGDDNQNRQSHQPFLGKPSPQAKRLLIPRFNLPLYGDPVFDFTEHEDLFPDFEGYKDNNTSDTDGLDESTLSQDDELRSEFDFEGSYEDVSQWVGDKLPAFRHQFLYAYVRAPKAIHQFGARAVLLNGKPVQNEEYRVQDISPRQFPGNQPAKDIDLSLCIMTSYGARVFDESGFTIPAWRSSREWFFAEGMEVRDFFELHVMESQNLHCLGPQSDAADFEVKRPESGVQQTKVVQREGSPRTKRPKQFCEEDLILLAKGTDPNRSQAIGLYMPQESPLNRLQVVGIDRKTGEIAYSEDRRVQSYLIATHRIRPQWSVRSRQILTGLLAPAHGDADVYEAIRGEIFLLFGTPSQILKAAHELKARYQEI